MFKKIPYILLGMTLMVSGTVLAAPYFTYQRTLLPETNNAFDLGTSTAVWRDLFVTQICLSGDCKTAWPTGGSGASFGWPFTVNSWGNSTTSVLGFNGFLSTASSTISSALRLSSLSQGFLYTGSTGLVQPIASSSIKLSWFNNDAGFITSAASTTLLSDTNSWTGGNTFVNSTSTNLGATNFYANNSAGMNLHANNGTDIAILGAGNTANATFYGGFNIDGATRLSTSLTGLLKATAGAVTTGTNGTDYTLISANTCSAGNHVSAITAAGAITCSADTASFPFTVNTGYNSTTSTIGFITGGLFSTASSTFSGNFYLPALSQGIAYIGSNGKVNTTATSTFSLSQFTNDLANLTALDTSLTFSGSYNGSAARTVGLNTGRTNTWTVLQNFNYSSSTVYSSFLTASTTFLNAGSITVATSSAGCAAFMSSGLLVSTGVACGSGSATYAADSIITTNSAGALIATGTQLTVGNIIGTTTASSYFLGKVGIGSTTPSYALVVAPTSGVTAGRTLSVYDATPSTGITTLTIRRGADAGVSNLLQLVDNSENLQTAFDQGGTLNFGGSLQRPFIGGNGLGLGDSDYIHLANSSPFTWSSTNDGQGTADLGIYRNAAGILEVNNGTAGVLASMKFAYSSSTAYSSFLTSSSTFAQIGQLTLSTTTAGTLKVTTSGLVYSDTASGGSGIQDPFSHAFPWLSASTSSFAFGTTTISNAFASTLTLASTTSPQLSLSNGTGIAQWIFRNAGGNLYIATTTVVGTATTSREAFSINGRDGAVLITGTGSTTITGPIVQGLTPIGLSNSVFTTTGSVNSYLQHHLQNTSTGNNASAVYVVGDNRATDTTYFAEFGINNSGYAQSAFASQNAGDGFLNVSDGGLVIGTASSTNRFADLRFTTGGTASTSIRMMFDYRGYGMMGTTSNTSLATLTLASSTKPQLSLSAGVNLAQWTLRNAGGNLYFSTSTVAGTATSSPLLSLINANGYVGIGSSTPAWTLGVVGTTTVKGQLGSLMASTTVNTSLTGYTINWANGNTARITLNGNATLIMNATSSNPVDGFKYAVKFCQDGTGSRTVTWTTPGNLSWDSRGTTTISATAKTATWIGFIYDGIEQKYNAVASSTGASCQP